MIVGLIPARGGSKGIPRKNIREIAGKPLIAWTIEAARNAAHIDRVVVSTEDEEIAEIARSWGAEVPFMRPAEMASDEAPGIDPVLHALGELPEAQAIVLLQPTSPLRSAADVDALIDYANEKDARSVVSVCEVADHPAHMYRRHDNGCLDPFAKDERAARRQDLPPLYQLNGAIYFADAAWLSECRTLVAGATLGHVMSREASVDVDTMLDWRLAELLLNDLRDGDCDDPEASVGGDQDARKRN